VVVQQLAQRIHAFLDLGRDHSNRAYSDLRE
jgi:hypothetical protein